MSAFVDISGVAEISDEGIKKHFKNTEAWYPLFELIWNGFDAKAQQVHVSLEETHMGGTALVTVLDDGVGIEHTTLKDTFGRFYDSAKKADPAQHGSDGRGRLAFHTICQHATWHSRSSKGDVVIKVSAAKIKAYKGTVLPAAQQCENLRNVKQGTFVELSEFTTNLPAHLELRQKLSIEFGWFLALRPEKHLSVNDELVAVPANDITSQTLTANGHAFDVQVIRWHEKPGSEKSYIYLMNGSGDLVHKELSTLNNKPGFFTSVCLTSAWADAFSPGHDLFNTEGHTLSSTTWKSLSRKLSDLTDSIFDEFLRDQAERVVERYVEEGYFPTYNGLQEEEKVWRLNNSRELVKQIYLADPGVFNSTGKKQCKLIIRLLDRLAVSNENESLVDVLNSVLDLDANSLKKLAGQLNQTTLENIVATIEILQRRQTAVQQLRVLMKDHYREVLETPDLQQIIENNTWLFGPSYETIGAEEDSFTRIAKALHDKVAKGTELDGNDVELPEDLQGAQRQTDLFLARKIPTYDSRGQRIFRCIVIEIKRPAISLNKKHLRQLEDYADIIKRFPEFNSEKMHFELILVGRQISSADEQIKSRLNGQIARGELGLVSDDPGMKCYVMNWYTLLDSFELSNDFMLERLKLKRAEFADSTKAELVAELQESH